jgi:ribonucleoside-diphosphate reductase beta chain
MDFKCNNRFTLFPIKDQDIWNFYKIHEANFWTAEEIDLSKDQEHWKNNLKDDERYFIKNILAFFAGSDGIVSENLALNFYKEIELPEARGFLGFQNMIEFIHSETYSLLINTYITDKNEKEYLFNAIQNIPAIKQKADWAIKYMNPDLSLENRLLAFVIVEGLFFSASFCSIYWIKQKGLMPGLTFSNELIARDERLHHEFTTLLYNKLNKRISESDVHRIVKEAVEIEKEFITKSLPVKLLGMNDLEMIKYIEFVADRLLLELKYSKIYNASNPFLWMNQLSSSKKENFFEVRVANYTKSNVGKSNKQKEFSLNSDF